MPLGIEDLDLILKERRLRWYEHVEHSNGAVKTACDIQVDGKHGLGRPKMTWKQLTERDCREWKLSAIDPDDRHTWRSGVRSAMRAASQLPGRGPLMWMLSLYLHVNKKSGWWWWWYHTCHISHCEIRSHRIWPIWKAIPIKNSNLTEFSDHFTTSFMKK